MKQNIKAICQNIDKQGTQYIYGVNWQKVTNNFDEKIVSKLAWEVDIFYLKEFQDALIKAWQENKPCWGNDEKFYGSLDWDIQTRLQTIHYYVHEGIEACKKESKYEKM